MQFYKVLGDLVDTMTMDKVTKRAFAQKIAIKTEQFNGENDSKYCFLVDIKGSIATFCIITRHFTNLCEFVEKFAAFCEFGIKNTTVEEITLNNLQLFLDDADREDFIQDDTPILRRFELSRVLGRHRNQIDFGENLIRCDDSQREDLIREANKYFMNETLVPELERIYEGSKNLYAAGHPVHYIVETDDRDTRREVYQIILNALRANCRLLSTRYAFLDFHPGENYSHTAYEALYHICENGAVVVRYLAGECENDDLATSERDTIEHLCETARLHRNKVLTVFCFPRECKKIKKQFYEQLGTMTFIEVREDFLDGAAAERILASLAKEKHVRTDKKLFADIKPDATYLAAELQKIFEEWYDGKLKRTVYPQYQQFSTVCREVVKAQPKGSAYDELREMVGLADAKQVIQKALNYYKMQKLYEAKGVKTGTPAMHMVFSGNPGTAKTTVARLFARIMRENGLLSKGHLVEVGRGDLVGKFVGWTAPTVQAKFKAATGGVLFIDEAYSLVDDRNGSYGDEAINAIVQEMENHRDDMVVIFAGYPDEMETFLQKNPGLRSRIAFHVPFADYDSGELCQIAEMIGKKNGMQFEKSALDKLEKAFEIAKKERDFGNGRYVRNLFEQAKMNQASRLLEKDFDAITTEEITTITAEDVVIPTTAKTVKKQIGFYSA
ncbi:MAG: AAA family ATPase [Clostridia bacterium]|nr:AAA family ATPase [Clostridia bacterium]